MSEVLALKVALDLVYEENKPKAEPRRVKGAIAEDCPCCAYPLDSDQHINHCRS